MAQPEHSVPSARGSAYHEAGHAVVGELLGIPLEYVTVIPDEERFGHTKWLDALALPDKLLREMTAEDRVRVEDAIVVLFAGKLAEEKFLGGASPETVIGFGADPDIEGPHRSSPGSDRETVFKLTEDIILDPEECSSFHVWLELRALKLLNNSPMVWLEIGAVADELIARGSLDRNAVRAIMWSVDSGDWTA